MEGKTIAPIEVKMGFKWQGLVLSVIVGMAIWLIPIPEGLSAKAWGMLALFVATIVAIIAKAMPMGAATLVALVISGLTGLTPLSPAKGEVGMLSGFSNGTIWLIAIAMFLSRAVIKTGLGKRIALYFVARFVQKNDGRCLWYRASRCGHWPRNSVCLCAWWRYHVSHHAVHR